MKIRLESINLKGGISYSTLIQEWEDIKAMANKGMDFYGRGIELMEIRCSDGRMRTYTPEQIEGLN